MIYWSWFWFCNDYLMSKLVERGLGIKGKKNREMNEHMKIEHHVFSHLPQYSIENKLNKKSLKITIYLSD